MVQPAFPQVTKRNGMNIQLVCEQGGVHFHDKQPHKDQYNMFSYNSQKCMLDLTLGKKIVL